MVEPFLFVCPPELNQQHAVDSQVTVQLLFISLFLPGNLRFYCVSYFSTLNDLYRFCTELWFWGQA